MTHYIIQVGNFFGSFFIYLVLDLENNDPVVFGVNFQFFLCPPCNLVLCIFLFLNALIGLYCARSGPFLSALHNIRFCPFLLHLSQITSDAEFQRSQAKKYQFFLPKKYKKAPSPILFFSPISRVVYCFLTVSRSVAQNVFNASQGVRDIGFLSWTPLTIFPPQVSCMKQGYIAWLPP